MYVKELEEAHFSLSIGDANQSIQLNTTPLGMNYPYRDSCSTKNYPSCISGQACYWKSRATEKSGDNLNIEIRNANDLIFSESVPGIYQQELNQNELKCDRIN